MVRFASLHKKRLAAVLGRFMPGFLFHVPGSV